MFYKEFTVEIEGKAFDCKGNKAPMHYEIYLGEELAELMGKVLLIISYDQTTGYLSQHDIGQNPYNKDIFMQIGKLIHIGFFEN